VSQKALRVAINIERDEYLRVYRGTARTVFAYSVDGKSVQFPVNILQKYVDQDGVHGEFIIHFDTKNKFKSIEKVG